MGPIIELWKQGILQSLFRILLTHPCKATNIWDNVTFELSYSKLGLHIRAKKAVPLYQRYHLSSPSPSKSLNVLSSHFTVFSVELTGFHIPYPHHLKLPKSYPWGANASQAIMTNNTSDNIQHLSEPQSPTLYIPKQSPVVDLVDCEEAVDAQPNETPLNVTRSLQLTRDKCSNSEATPYELEEVASISNPSSPLNDERSRRGTRDQDDENSSENVPGKKIKNSFDTGSSNSVLQRSTPASAIALVPHAHETTCNMLTRSKLNHRKRATIGAHGEVICITSNTNQTNDPLHFSSGENQTRESKNNIDEKTDNNNFDEETRSCQAGTRRRLARLEDLSFNQIQVESDRSRRNTRRSNPSLPQRVRRNSHSVDLINLDDDTTAPPEQVKRKGSEAGAARPKDSGTPRRSQRKNNRNNLHGPSASSEIILEQNEAAREAVDLEGKPLNMIYSGPTHLIFKYPPNERGSIKVTAEERERLYTRKYLNDSVIDFYIKYLETCRQKWHKDLTKSCLFFSSFFFGRMTQSRPIDYNGVKSWTKSIDLFEKKFVFVPICDSSHWSLIVIVNLNNLEQSMSSRDPTTKVTARDVPRIIYFDSLDPERGAEFGAKVCTYLSEEWYERKEETKTLERKKQISNLISKKVKTRKPLIPIQSNEHDCGLYLLMCLSMFLDNNNNFYEKVMEGELNLQEAFSHTEVEILRREIMGLMDRLECNWKRKNGSFGVQGHEGLNKGTLSQSSEAKNTDPKSFNGEKIDDHFAFQTPERTQRIISDQENATIKDNGEVAESEKNVNSPLAQEVIRLEENDVLMKENDVNKKVVTQATKNILEEAGLGSATLDDEIEPCEQIPKRARNARDQGPGSVIVDENMGDQSALFQHDKCDQVMELEDNIEGQCNPLNRSAQRSADQLSCSQSISDDEVIDIEKQLGSRHESRPQMLARIVKEGEAEDTSVIDAEEDLTPSNVPEQNMFTINVRTTNVDLVKPPRHDEGHDTAPTNRTASNNIPLAVHNIARTSVYVDKLQNEAIEGDDLYIQQEKKSSINSVDVSTEMENHMIIEINPAPQLIQSDDGGQISFLISDELVFDQNEHSMLNGLSDS